jgi:hypothetical protein
MAKLATLARVSLKERGPNRTPPRGTKRPNASLPKFPPPRVIRRKYYLLRHEAENFKRLLAGLPVAKEPPDKLEFVALPDFAKEIGVCLGTVKRWMKSAEAARVEAEAEA